MNLKKLRETKGITQTELAKELGVVRSTICQYEKGNREPDMETLIKIADYFGVSIDFILDREENLDGSPAPSFNEREGKLLQYFRMLSPALQDVALDTVRVLAGIPAESDLHKKA